MKKEKSKSLELLRRKFKHFKETGKVSTITVEEMEEALNTVPPTCYVCSRGRYRGLKFRIISKDLAICKDCDYQK